MTRYIGSARNDLRIFQRILWGVASFVFSTALAVLFLYTFIVKVFG